MTPVVTLSDAQLRALLPSGERASNAVEELTRRYGDVILACVQGLGATTSDAQELSAEALARTLDACHQGAPPALPWIPCLLREARHLAARRAETGQRHSVSPGFLHWLDQQSGPHHGYRATLSAAEEQSPLLRSFETLTNPSEAVLWRGLIASPGSDGPPAPARQELADAYARLYVAAVPDRRCRHQAARLTDEARYAGPATAYLTRHMTRCRRCTRALEDLRAIHQWDVRVLMRRLLVHFDPPTTRPTAGPPRRRTATEPPGPTGDGSTDRPPAPLPDRPTAGSASAGTSPPRTYRRAVLTAAGIGTAVLALGSALTAPPADHPTGSPAPITPAATASDRSSTSPQTPAELPTSAVRTPETTSRPSRTGSASPSSPPPSTRHSPPAPAIPSPVPPPPSTRHSPPPSEPSPVPPPVPPPAPASPTPPPRTTPAPAPSHSPTPSARLLSRGDQGPDVARLQDLLVRAGCGQLNVPYVEGLFDRATAEFLTAFQTAADIRGEERSRAVYGTETRQALEGTGPRPTCWRT
ncbi:hypothetical protein PUR61_17385 [Streptomyces sp. BE20]|uniref:peptidoglycan-binding domain-containing protein n=1 Tax=unclassified Streptomyces TaxID=2593676 RepID=UPI002E76C6AF|nr:MULTISPECIES: hypothetical protein [unclassified Streptomyces]MED7954685.1 hypothetical protein [Streptomyces sp. BE303]MEE1823950.1 hypothetical protein [Streptomyces sp. BE20]